MSSQHACPPLLLLLLHPPSQAARSLLEGGGGGRKNLRQCCQLVRSMAKRKNTPYGLTESMYLGIYLWVCQVKFCHAVRKKKVCHNLLGKFGTFCLAASWQRWTLKSANAATGSSSSIKMLGVSSSSSIPTYTCCAFHWRLGHARLGWGAPHNPAWRGGGERDDISQCTYIVGSST